MRCVFIEWQEVVYASLSIQPGFLAKTQLPDVLPKAILVGRLPIVATIHAVQFWCPARCVNSYLQGHFRAHFHTDYLFDSR